ncbi:MAG: hypothetical protein KTR16_13815 [Acidiferrobacterales bacterium]|nr:hypothetical protein [Acidiferrobacterales bacterium]
MSGMKSSMNSADNLNNHVFVPITDDMIYNHPECIEGPLVPYEAGMECHEWLSIELNPEDDSVIDEVVRKRARENKKSRDLRKKTANLSLVYAKNLRGC